jgi:pyruvate dehydrogenase E2 component (dihydrolipoamide acetyltransferase)
MAVTAVQEYEITMSREPLSRLARTPSPATIGTFALAEPPMAELKEARVPDIGGYDDVPVIELLVAVGDTVSEGSVVAIIEPAGEAAAAAPAAPAAPPRAEPAAPQATTVAAETATKVEPVVVPAQPDRIAQQSIEKQPASTSAPAALDSRPGIDPEASPPRTPPVAFTADELLPEKVPYASPAVRLFARELGVDLSQVKGSERGGRISKDDVSKFVKSVMTGGGVAATGVPVAGGGGLNLLPWPKVDFAKFGEIETRELSRIQKISGANLARNWAMIPHVTQHDDADITDLEELRVALNKENEKAGIKLTMLAFLMKASVAALQKYPTFNSSLDASGENLTLKKYFHIGFAADTPNGLVVPVVRDCDKKGVLQIAQETGELAKKARDGKLGPADMQGGCFSISSLGGIGGTKFTPIVNAPEVAILGVSKSAIRPVWDGKQFAPRLILPLSLSYDHRVIDGAAAARFTAYLAQLLADMRRVLL